jgi:steroid 5-alpha reductase family enzyme
MLRAGVHDVLVGAMFAFAVVTFIALRFVVAPYGRHTRGGYGPAVPARLGWVAMESPAVIVAAAVYAAGAHAGAAASCVLFALWQVHYVQRVVVYPLRMRPGARGMPVGVAAMAFVFNVVNAVANMASLAHFAPRDAAWLCDGRFVCGVVLFVAGMVINVTSDATLRRLRAPGQTGYQVPRGSLFRLVSCPNYLGEMLEWCGYALAAWSLAGLAFAACTVANLLPRALSHHRWYRETFADYPKDRKAVVPWVL